jgi:hypothetical protein
MTGGIKEIFGFFIKKTMPTAPTSASIKGPMIYPVVVLRRKFIILRLIRNNGLIIKSPRQVLATISKLVQKPCKIFTFPVVTRRTAIKIICVAKKTAKGRY